jgi:hypothetical protein
VEFLSGPGTGSPKALVEMLPDLRKQLAAAEARASQALAEVEGLRQVVTGVEAMASGATRAGTVPLPLFVEGGDAVLATVENDGPRGREAVATLLREQPDRVWTTPELAKEIRRRGWIKPGAQTSAIRVAARRLSDDGVARKLGPGRYKLADSERGRG